jgi:putative Mn2+ efflux pump MntP
MDYFFDYFLFNWLGGIIFTIIGVWQLFDTIKNTQHETNSVLQPFVNGLFFSIGLIVFGVIIIYFKITGKW